MRKILYWLGILICIAVVIAFAVLQLLVDKAIISSDLPWWLKIFLLGGK